jgi:hypothetical protein
MCGLSVTERIAMRCGRPQVVCTAMEYWPPLVDPRPPEQAICVHAAVQVNVR